MARNDVVVSNVRIPKKLHALIREQAALHQIDFSAELVARVIDSFHYEHWKQQRDALLSLSETR